MSKSIIRHNPDMIHKPIGNLYTHGIEVPSGARLLFIAGQVGADVHGKTPSNIETELDLAWGNVRSVLESAGMTFDDLVKITCYISVPEYADAYGRSVVKYLNGVVPTMTAPIVKQLWNADWHYEIDAITAKIDSVENP
jgi:2-iminobutanoate/2-iminopropanoate deaminase